MFVSGIDQIAWEIFVVRILVNNFVVGRRRDDLLPGDASLFQPHIDMVRPPDFSLFYALPNEC